MHRILFWGVLLLYSFEIQGLQHVFVRRGKDLRLDVKESVVLDEKTDFFWKFNSTNNVAKRGFNKDPIVFDKYERRAELLGQNFYLLLKNVQHSDSGAYTAVVVGGQDRKVAEYKVQVQDPVSPVKLTVTSISSHSCNITVTCTTAGSYIRKTFRCDGKNCSQAEEKSLNTANDSSSLTVYLREDVIICNHSNRVSWEHDKKINPYCETESVSRGAFIIGAVVFIFGIAFVVLCIVRKVKRGKLANAPYEAPQDMRPGQTHVNMSEDALCPSPTTTYATVQFQHRPEFTETKNNPQPETVYAQVNRAVKPKSTAQKPKASAREQAAESIYRTKHM